RHESNPVAVALAWTIRSGHVISIPESGSATHVRQNAAALSLRLTAQDLGDLDRAFDHHLFEFGHLRLTERRWPPGARSSCQASHIRRVVAMHPVAQCLAVHPASRRRTTAPSRVLVASSRNSAAERSKRVISIALPMPRTPRQSLPGVAIRRFADSASARESGLSAFAITCLFRLVLSYFTSSPLPRMPQAACPSSPRRSNAIALVAG